MHYTPPFLDSIQNHNLLIVTVARWTAFYLNIVARDRTRNKQQACQQQHSPASKRKLPRPGQGQGKLTEPSIENKLTNCTDRSMRIRPQPPNNQQTCSNQSTCSMHERRLKRWPACHHLCRSRPTAPGVSFHAPGGRLGAHVVPPRA